MDKNRYHDSNQTVDFACELEGEVYNIEMNNNTSISSLERNVSYVHELYKSKMQRGGTYNYQKTIQINLNNFSFVGNDKTMEEYQLRNEDGVILTDKIKIIFIYFPKIRR